jgi:hypothetical protein
VLTKVAAKSVRHLRAHTTLPNSIVFQSGQQFIPCNISVSQGENLSPLLFALYLNDFESYVANQFNGLSGDIAEHLNMGYIELYFNIFVLLYTDDTIILDPVNLQNALNVTLEYCE